VPGFYSAGNVVHVYDLVDWVSEAGLMAGKSAAQYCITGGANQEKSLPIKASEGVRYVVPHIIHPEHLAEKEIQLQFRVRAPMEFPVWVEVRNGEKLVTRKPEPYVRPGEMVTIKLRQNLFDEVSSASELSVAVVKRG
jgi:hypothetical protein